MSRSSEHHADVKALWVSLCVTNHNETDEGTYYTKHELCACCTAVKVPSCDQFAGHGLGPRPAVQHLQLKLCAVSRKPQNHAGVPGTLRVACDNFV